MQRNQSELIALAGHYANERCVPATAIATEILHYELLHALVQSGAASNLTLQGGTALRLCYQGTRHSEDIHFAGGQHFKGESMTGFRELLTREIGEAYGLVVEVKDPGPGSAEDGVPVARWSARIQIPQVDRAVPQKQIIHIEVASVAAHDVGLMPVLANYPHLPGPLRQILIVAQSQEEILADKLVALGTRAFLKGRDIWDIKFLTDRQVQLNVDLIARKLVDHGWTEAAFKERLGTKLALLKAPETANKFREELVRFVDTTVAGQLTNQGLVQKYLARSYALGARVLASALHTS
jgi:predicted nucleotidyltransferase component of viral defense system